MPSLQEIVNALYGSWRYARMDPDALKHFDTSLSGFWKSFFAAVLIAPAFAAIVAADVAGEDFAVGLLYLTLIHAIAYVINWIAYPLVCYWICEEIDRSATFVPFIVAYNWTQVIQMAVYLPVVLIAVWEILPGNPVVFLKAAFMVWMLLYQWFVTRQSLAVGGPAAAGFVVLDLVLKFVVQYVVLYRVLP